MRQNDGLITRRTLRQIGFGEKEIHSLLSCGDLRRLHRGVYADGRSPLSDHALLRAALLAFGGRDAWLSGQAASMGWGLERVSLPNLEVTVVAGGTPRRRATLRVRSVRIAPHPSELRMSRGLRMSSIPRLLVECAASGASSERLGGLIEVAVRKNLLDVADLAATLARNGGRPGTGAVRALCEEYLPHHGRKSGFERAFDRWLAGHPEIPPPQRNIKLGIWEIDCYWPQQRVALELDGRSYHTAIEDIERDHRKDIWLQGRGIRILRVSDRRFSRDHKGVHRDLTTMLALGAELTTMVVLGAELTTTTSGASPRRRWPNSQREA